MLRTVHVRDAGNAQTNVFRHVQTDIGEVLNQRDAERFDFRLITDTYIWGFGFLFVSFWLNTFWNLGLTAKKQKERNPR